MYNFKNVKNTHEEVTLLHGCFLRFLVVQMVPNPATYHIFLLTRLRSMPLSCISYPANIYLFKVNNRNTRKSCEICSKLTIFSRLSAVFAKHSILDVLRGSIYDSAYGNQFLANFWFIAYFVANSFTVTFHFFLF